MAIVCGACGAENPDNARFCINCGTGLASACPSCGNENPPGANFCANCGAAPRDVLRRIDAATIKRFDELYDSLPEGSLVDGQSLPKGWRDHWERADADRF